MIKIKRALISVSDKTGILDLAKTLHRFRVEILSTGGTARLLKEHHIPVKEVSEYTGSPEILDGRVKTLHPAIHAGLLALRDHPAHVRTMKDLGLGFIDMAVINLYPFERTIAGKDVTEEEAIENIDIGGPSMMRSAAKNFHSVAVVSSPAQYRALIKELLENDGGIGEATARRLACEVFARTSAYDRAINRYLSNGVQANKEVFAQEMDIALVKIQQLRYGENPHQKAAFYGIKGECAGMAALRQLQGKELSFNNILDIHSAWELAREFKSPAAAVVKHNNPCGAAMAASITVAFKDAWRGDPLSAFGGIVALNRPVDGVTAGVIARCGFLECIIAPSFNAQARGIFSKRKNLRLLELPLHAASGGYDVKKVSGAFLLQDNDTVTIKENNFRLVTKRKPTPAQMKTLLFAWKVAKHVKSNAIVLAKATRTVGIGAGQMSRVDSVRLAKMKAGTAAAGACLASDGFFPKPDAVARAASMGVKAIIQPGGSIADQVIINACNKYKIAMVVTGIRHFKH